MLYDILFVLWFFLPAGLANTAPIFAARLPVLKDWNFPLVRTFVSLDYTSIHPLLFGFLASSGALAGDAFKSFLKRQAGIAPGKTWFPFDQLDYVLGGIAFTCVYVPLSLLQYLLLVLVWFLLHAISTFMGYELRLKESPI